MYDQLLGQFNRYMGHVAGNIGGIYEYYKTSDQEGNVYTHVAKDHQKEAVKFLNEQLFETPTWMLDKSIFGKTEFTGAIERIRSMQTRILNSALSVDRMGRMIENETLNGNDAYSVINLFSDLRQGVWSELYNGKSIDTYRRNLQKAHVERLGYLLNDADDARGRGELGSVSANQSDIKSIARGELKRIQRDAKNASNSGNTLRRYHLQDVVDRIDMILDPK